MSIKIQGTSGVLANVDADQNLLVNPPLDSQTAGFTTVAGEVDPGTVTGTRLVKEIEATEDFRLRVGIDQLLFQESFNGTVLNSGVFNATVTTMTVTVANQFMNLNAANSVATSAVARVQTYRTMPTYGTFPLYVEFIYDYTTTDTVPVLNNTTEIGVGFAAGTAAPTDGIFIRYNATGTIMAVISYGGTETSPVTIAPANMPVNTRTHLAIAINHDSVFFFVNDVMVANMPVTSTRGLPSFSQEMPILLRTYNSTSIAPLFPVQIRVAQINCTIGDMEASRPWELMLAGNGQGAYQTQSGSATFAQTANYANSAAPASATLANATAGYTTLGGQFQFVAVAGAETDYALFAYQVTPVAAVNISGKNLYICGIRISTFNSVVAVATTATVLQWAIAVGSTAASLATAEGATTKAPRRLALGVQTFPVGAAVGASPAPGDIVQTFDAPLFCENGTFVHVILKMPIATATATEIFRGTVLINAVYE